MSSTTYNASATQGRDDGSSSCGALPSFGFLLLLLFAPLSFSSASTPGINEESPTMRLEGIHTFTATGSPGGGAINWTVDKSVNYSVTPGAFTATGTSVSFDLSWDQGITTYVIKAADSDFKDELSVQVFPPDQGINYRFRNPYQNSPEVEVRIQIPSNVSRDANVISVHHGMSRTNYFAYWTDWGKRAGWIIVAPHFPDSGAWGGSRGYALGNMFSGSEGTGSVRPIRKWSFTIAVDFARSVLEGFDLRDQTFDIWGHSAGGQFSHRVMFFIRDAPIRRGLPANPGWWTLPVYDKNDPNFRYPYGPFHPKLKYDQLDVARFTSMHGIINAGDSDTQRDSGLRTTPEAEFQGRNRWQRANFMFERVQEASLNHAWEFNRVEGVGHNGLLMAQAAQDWLDANPPPSPTTTPRRQTRAQQRCTNALNADFAKVARAQDRAIFKCLKNKARKGESAVACLALPNRGVDRARDRTRADEDRRCGETPPDFGPLDADTVNEAAVAAEHAMLSELFGADLDAALVAQADDKSAARCQQKVVKAVHKCQSTQIKEFNRCKKTTLKNGGATSSAGLARCLAFDPKGRIAKKCDPQFGALATKVLPRICEGVDLLEAFPGCGTADPGELASCLDEAIACRVCLGLNEADGLSEDCDLFDDGESNASCL